MRPATNLNVSPSFQTEPQKETRTLNICADEDCAGLKFYCTEFHKEVEREDCINCIKWDDCPEREDNSMMILSLALSIVFCLIVGFVLGAAIGSFLQI